MASNKTIKAHVKANFGFVPDDCWIAHARAARRIQSEDAALRIDIGTPAKPCAEHKRAAIFKALRELNDA